MVRPASKRLFRWVQSRFTTSTVPGAGAAVTCEQYVIPVYSCSQSWLGPSCQTESPQWTHVARKNWSHVGVGMSLMGSVLESVMAASKI